MNSEEFALNATNGCRVKPDRLMGESSVFKHQELILALPGNLPHEKSTQLISPI